MSANKVNQSRRAFLQRMSSLTAAGIAAPWALNFAAMAEASAQGASDYKALVCVYLHGGNDWANMLPPYDPDSYEQYRRLRSSFAHPRQHLSNTVLKPTMPVTDAAGYAHDFALAPTLAPLLPLFDTGQLAIVLNAGPLIEPTSKKQYLANAVRLPPKLFSHHDQSVFWHSASAEGATSGWGGRLGDLLQASNPQEVFTCINLSSHAVFLCGRERAQYQMTSRGSVPLAGIKEPLFGSRACSATLRELITEPRVHWLENAHNAISKRSVEADEILSGALAATASPLATSGNANTLDEQLQMVARMVAAGPAMGMRRQVFFVALGGFDNHDSMASQHPQLMQQLGTALADFYAATSRLGLAQSVTAFTASEFGRSLTGNNDGSEHGWGSAHLVLGGAVRGKRFYGTAPVIASDGPDDVGQGRMIPTTSVEQLAATLGSWLGISDSELLAMLPNLANFNVSERKLGFV